MEKQSIALANLLKQKYEIINYTPPYFLKKLPLLGKFYFSNILKKILLNRKSPTYIITCGKRMAGISIFIKSKLNDKIKTIHIQNPGVSIKYFDLLIIPEHDHVTGSNIIQTKGALNFFNYSELKNKYEYIYTCNQETQFALQVITPPEAWQLVHLGTRRMDYACCSCNFMSTMCTS